MIRAIVMETKCNKQTQFNSTKSSLKLKISTLKTRQRMSSTNCARLTSYSTVKGTWPSRKSTCKSSRSICSIIVAIRQKTVLRTSQLPCAGKSHSDSSSAINYIRQPSRPKFENQQNLHSMNWRTMSPRSKKPFWPGMGWVHNSTLPHYSRLSSSKLQLLASHGNSSSNNSNSSKFRPSPAKIQTPSQEISSEKEIVSFFTNYC